MKILPNDPAFPFVETKDSSAAPGLSIRAQFAAMAMQGFLANPNHLNWGNRSELLKVSVEMADRLIEELNRPVK